MLRFKAFTTASSHGEVGTLEHAVNQWISKERPRIHYYSQTAVGVDLVITFVYEGAADTAEAQTATVATEVPQVFEEELDGADLDPSDLDAPTLPEAELPY